MKRIVIEYDLCCGNGRCYEIGPEFFTDDERGYGQVVGDGVISDDQVDNVTLAVRGCPENAISLEDVERHADR